MKFSLKRTLDVLFSLAVIGAGAALIYGNQWNPEFGERVALLLDKPIVTSSIGAMLILSIMFRILAAGSKHRSQKSDYIRFKCDDGTIGISPKAIRDFIQRIGQEFDAIRSLDSKLTQRKEMLDVKLSVKISAGHKIKELSSLIQMRVRQSLRDDLGLEDKLRNIDIQVQEIVGEPGKSVAARPVPVSTPRAEPQPEPVKPTPAPEPEPKKDPKVEEEPAPVEKTEEKPEKKSRKQRRKRAKKKLDEPSQYIFKPNKNQQHLVQPADDGEGEAEEVELDEEDNPFLPE